MHFLISVCSWLKKWKLRADCEERRKERDRKLEENTNSNGKNIYFFRCYELMGENV
jgi:hypothetical protein